MRKIQVLVFLTLIISLLCCVCLAENVREVTFEGFKVTAVVPEGYVYSDKFVSDILYYGLLLPQSQEKPTGMVTIAYDEDAQGKTLNELSDEEIDEMISVFLLDTPAAEVSKSETGKGTKIIILDTQTENESLYDIVTIWKGYQVAVRVLPGNGATELTEEQKAMVLQFLTDITIDAL